MCQVLLDHRWDDGRVIGFQLLLVFLLKLFLEFGCVADPHYSKGLAVAELQADFADTLVEHDV